MRTEKERNVTGRYEDEIERQGLDEDERVIQLVSSSVSLQDDGDVAVWVHAHQEPWVAKTGMRLIEDDAWELSDALREAAQRVAGSEPQRFIRLRLLDDDNRDPPDSRPIHAPWFHPWAGRPADGGGGVMDRRSGRDQPDDAADDRLILGIDPGMVTFRCADCGAVGEPGGAASTKAFVIDQLLGCEPSVYALLLGRSLAPQATAWLRGLGYGRDQAAEFIGAALELGLLDGEPESPRLGAPRCAECYMRRGEAFEARHGQEPSP